MPACIVLACNRNADHSRNKFCAQHLFKNYHITCLQETSFSSPHGVETFQAQVNAEYHNTMFVNDRGTSSDVHLHGKHGGVCTILHTDFSGSDTATHMVELDVSDRYMVVHAKWSQTDVYIHNVYAPVQVADALPSLNLFPGHLLPSVFTSCAATSTRRSTLLSMPAPLRRCTVRATALCLHGHGIWV